VFTRESTTGKIPAHLPATLAAVTVGLAAIAGVACWIPARRAAVLEPMDAMRVE
jgi:ABC-type lipoprotein release transport system permease subunit